MTDELFDYKFTADTTAATSNIDNLISKLQELNTLATSLGSKVTGAFKSISGSSFNDIYGYGDTKAGKKATSMRENVEIRKEALQILNRDLETTRNISAYASEVVSKKIQESEIQKQISQTLAANENYIQNIIAKKEADKKITDKVKEATKEVSKETKNNADETENWLKKLTKISISFATVRKLAQLFTNVVKISSDYVENLNLAEVAFGTSSKEMVSWALDFSTNMGLANDEILKAISNFKILANTVGLTGDIGTQISQTLTQVGYDLGSLRNIDFNSLFTSLQSVIYSGQVRVGYRLGLDISEESLNQLLSDLNLDTTIRKLSQSDKVLLRFIKTMQSLGDEGANIFGDLSKTISSLANRVRVFQGSMQNLGLVLGDFVSPYLAEIVGYANAFIQAITEILRTFKPHTLETGFQNITEDVEDAKDSVDELNGSLGLLSIDKFETLSGGTSDKSSYSDELANIAADYAEQYSKLSETFAKFDKQVNEIKNNIIKWVFPLSEVNEETGEIEINTQKMSGSFSAVLGILSAISGLGVALLIKKIGTSISAMSKSVSGLFSIITKINPLLTIIFAVLSYGYITNKEFRESINNLIGAIINLISTALKPVLSVLNLIFEIAQPILDFIYDLITPIIDLITKILQWKDGWVVLGTVLSAVGIVLISTVTVTIGLLRNNIKNVSTILKNFGTVLTTTKAKVGLLVTGITLLVSGLADLIGNWNQMSGLERTAKILTVLAGVAFLAASAFAAMHTSWSMGAAAIAIGVGLSAIIASLAVAASQAKETAKSVSDVGLYAKGGMPSMGSLFIAGESGAELVSTINGQTNVINKEQLSDALADAIRKSNQNNIGGNSSYTANLVVDGKVLARTTFKAFENEGRRKYGVGWRNS